MRTPMRIGAVLAGVVFLVCVCAGAAEAARQDDIWSMLKKDHDQVKKIMKQLRDGGNGKQFGALQQQLSPHMQFEEQYIYPALEKNQATRDLVIQGRGEHNMARQLIESMGKAQGDMARWKAKAAELDELLSAHVKNEEGKLFREGKRVINSDQARELGARYAQMKARRPKPLVQPESGR